MSLADRFEDDPRLRDIARAILEGTPVDWDSLESSAASESFRAVLRDLRLLSTVAVAQDLVAREPPPADTSSATPAAGAATVALPGQAALGTWGHLTLLEVVGRGSFGEVYRARDPRLDRDVALKLLHRPQPGQDANTAIDEGRALARVRHPHVVTVYGADRIDGRVGVWMDYVRGRTLAEVLHRHGSFSAQEAAVIGLDLCRALAAVHRAGLLHRDIKAQNVMREEGGRTVLMDFGTVTDTTDESGPADLAGTPLYLAPEVLGDGAPSVRSDIYSLGVLLYHLVTRDFPVRGRSLGAIRHAHGEGRCTLLRDVRPDLPGAFIDAVERATAVDQAQRFDSAGAFEQALARAVASTDVGSGSGAVQPQAPASTAPSRRRLWLAGASLLAIGALGAALWADLGGVRSRLRRIGPAVPAEAPAGVLARETSSEVVIRKVPMPTRDIGAYGRPSPDGRFFSFASGSGELMLLDLQSSTVKPLTNKGTSNEQSFGGVFAFDGDRLAYPWIALDGVFELRTINTDGTWPEVLLRLPEAEFIQPYEWSRDGSQISLLVVDKQGGNHLMVADVERKSTRLVADTDGWPTGATFSPDGRYLAYDRRPRGESYQRDIVLRDLETGDEVPLAASAAFDVHPQWTPRGDEVFFLSDRTGSTSAWVQRIANGRPDGAARFVGRDLGRVAGLGLTSSGAFYYQFSASMIDVYTAPADGATPPQPVSAPVAGQNRVPTWSPDGRALAWITDNSFLRAAEGSLSVVIRDMETGETRWITPKLGAFWKLQYSPDGRRFLVMGYRNQHRGIQIIDGTTGAVETAFADPEPDTPFSWCPQWAPDGQAIVFGTPTHVLRRELASGRDTVLRDLKAEGLLRPRLRAKGGCISLSPDGRAFATVDSIGEGERTIEVLEVTTSDTTTIELARTADPEERIDVQGWMTDGTEILFTKARRGQPMVEVWRVPARGGDPLNTGIALEFLNAVSANPRTGQLAFTAGSEQWELWVMENFLRHGSSR